MHISQLEQELIGQGIQEGDPIEISLSKDSELYTNGHARKELRYFLKMPKEQRRENPRHELWVCEQAVFDKEGGYSVSASSTEKIYLEDLVSIRKLTRF